MRRVLALGLVGGLALLLLLAALVWWLNVRGDDGSAGSATAQAGAAASPPDPAQIERGAYLARAGNCMGCHTTSGGAAYAGGRGVPTPFGTVYSPNLTPDVATGIGGWSAAHFWRAMHNGRSRDGRLLYPAFPYINYTRITRADSDAIHAYLRSLPAVTQANKPHALRFPVDQQAALAVWRALYFRPESHVDDPARPADWNRGAYLVESLGHCNACHSRRNALGATSGDLDLAGGLIPVQNWYAPSLRSPHEAGVADWSAAEVVRLLKSGIATAPGGGMAAVAGPMSEVVLGSTQHLTDADLRAMAAYLKALPQTDAAEVAMASSTKPAPAAASAPTAAPAPQPPDAAAAAGPGARLYEQHCAQCHGERGEGVPGAYPALAGNRAVTLASSTANLVHIVLEGGYPPVTKGNPRPYGMPPFATVLNADEVAQVLTHIRASWGNRADAVTALAVNRDRATR